MKFIDFARKLVIGFALVTVLVCAQSIQAADDTGSVQGVVKSASGQPLAGAFIKVKNEERHLTFMVISQDKGHFVAEDLPAGQYVVQGVGVGFQSAWSAPVKVSDGKAATVDVSLTAKLGTMLPNAWPGRIPESEADSIAKELPEGAGKELVSNKCTVCHDTQRIRVSRMDKEDWAHTVAAMRINMFAASVPDLKDIEAETIATYLAANFPPLAAPDPNSRLPRTRLQGKAMQYRAVEYALADHYAEPHDIVVDPKGNGWVAERAGKLGRLDHKTLEFTEVSLPPGPNGDHQRLGNPQIDANGVMWFADGPGKRWVSYDTNSGKFGIFEFPPKHGTAGGNSMALAKDGMIFETSANQVRMLNPVTKEWKFFDAPAHDKTGKDLGNYGITVAGDGSVWFAESNIDQMGKLNPTTGKIEEFKVPFDGTSYPRRMNTDAAGNVWVGLWTAGRLMKIDNETNKMTLYPPPTKTAGTYSVVVDKVNNLIWVSEQQADKIARYNPKTGEWLEFPLASSESDPRRIDLDTHNPNRVWWTGASSGRMGFVELLNGKHNSSD